jgi:lipopolysaccharide transport system ATP-binding protein
MSDIVIEVEGIGKLYQLGARERYETLRDKITRAVTAPFRIGRGRKDDVESSGNFFWALRNVSFDVHDGDVVGIIGRNGAGKSTLLKVLSRITQPTVGRARVRGRIASLLEVGTGFHPELTGRENIFLNGAILGMKRAEIRGKFDEIVEFAEITRFIDTPVKRYSSGMYMRLAFAVAAHLEPEILVIDEVLAVGDAAFQKKCLGKMRDVARTGRTVLFVSHNMTAMRNLCNRVVWLKNGEVNEIGEGGAVIANYLKSATATVSRQVWHMPETAPGNDHVRLHMVSAEAADDPGGDVTVATPVRLEVYYWNKKPGVTLNVAVEVYNIEEVCLFSSFNIPEEMPAGLIRATCEIPSNLLNDSVYQFRILIVRDANTIVFKHEGVTLEVHDIERTVPYYGKWTGALRPQLSWTSEMAAEPTSSIASEPINVCRAL